MIFARPPFHWSAPDAYATTIGDLNLLIRDVLFGGDDGSH